MSYPDFSYTPKGRQGVGVIQPQSGLDYPLVKPSDDIRYLIADFYLAYDDRGAHGTGPATSFPLRIAYLLGVGEEPADLPAGAPVPTHAADIVIVDSAGTEILNTTAGTVSFTAHDWSVNYRVYEWITPDATCRLVAYTTWQTGEPAPQHYAQHLAPANAVLDARAVHKLPKRLRSLSVRAKNSTVTSGPHFGNVRFKNSYNTEIVASPTTTTQFRNNTNINFSAEAGTGIGYFPECGAGYDENNEPIPQSIKRINGVAPTAGGDFILSAGDCLYIRRVSATQQIIGADCPPCCKCADYVQTAEYMNTIAANYRVIGDRVQAAKLVHYDNIAAFNQKRNCAVNNPLKLVVVPQCCPDADVVLMLCNSCQTCYPASTLKLKFDAPLLRDPETQEVIEPTISVVCGSTMVRNPDGTTANNFIENTPYADEANNKTGSQFLVNLPPVPAGSSAFVKFRVRVNNLSYATSPFTGTLTGTFVDTTNAIFTGCTGETNSDLRQQATVSKPITLNCSIGGSGNADPRCVEQ